MTEQLHSVRSTRESSGIGRPLPELNSSQANLPSELSQASEAISFYIGQQFSKFEDLEQHLKLYEEQQFEE